MKKKTSTNRRQFIANTAKAALALKLLPFHNLLGQGIDFDNGIVGLDSLPFENVFPGGELQKRMVLNFSRLQDPEFTFKAVSTASTVKDAPGDWIGRDILGLTLLSRVLHKDAPDNLKEIISRLPELFNEKGYIGPVLTSGEIDEGQVTGHNALIRGLSEYYLWKKDPQVLNYLQTMVTNLFIKNEELISKYPIETTEIKKADKVIGAAVGSTNVWKNLSSDTGQFFMTLDAITQFYQISPSKELKTTIETIINRFNQVDFVKVGYQTHSFLSALRGILRWFEITGDRKYLAIVELRYAAYENLAMTENYENYNWFGRPLWTEACGVIDSFMLTAQLWKITKKNHYLHWSHLILYNAIYAGQRPNGGFGTNVCTRVVEKPILEAHSAYEAPWCCSMRGSEGLAQQAAYTMFTSKDEVIIPFYETTNAELTFFDGALHISETSDYPYSGKSEFIIEKATTKKVKSVSFFIPHWADQKSVELYLNHKKTDFKIKNTFIILTHQFFEGDQIQLNFRFALREESALHKTKLLTKKYFHGPLLLGIDTQIELTIHPTTLFNYMGEGIYTSGNMVLRPLTDLTWMEEAKSKATRRQILFMG